MRENDLLAALPALFRSDDASVLVGVGPDDCAHLRTGTDGRLALSTDVFAEGSHFLSDTPPEAVAEKALLASVSDLAASACAPRWVAVGLCLRKSAPQDWAERFARALAAAAKEWDVAVVGGDTVSSPSATVVSVTVLGEPFPGGPVLRSGGRPGDVLAVTGELGGSILGKHLRPRPRVREIAALLAVAVPTACMDISDGLALDLSRLCRESGTGAVIEEDRVPVSAAARELAARTGKTPLAHALGDGEDFELLLALPPEGWRALAGGDAAATAALSGADAPLTRIGRLAEKRDGLSAQMPGGALRPLEPEGFEHAW